MIRFRSVLTLSFFLLAGTVACSRDAAPPEAQPEVTQKPARPVGEVVSTALSFYGEVDATVIATGSVIAPKTTLLSSEVSGRIADVRADEGDVLERGSVAFVIDPGPYRISLEEARAGLLLAEAEAAQESQELTRTKRLADQQIVARQELDYQETQVAVATARVSQARARLSRAERDLELTTVRVPYDSTVVERHLHEGANVAGPSSVVLTLQALEGFEAQLAIPEASPFAIAVGDPLTLEIQGSGAGVDTTVLSVNPRIDPDSRTYSLRAAIPLATAAKAGAFVRAEIKPQDASQVLVVPTSAVVRRDGRSLVFRYREERAEEVAIEIGATGREWTEIRSGLGANEEVIVGALTDRLANDSPVQRKGPPSEPAPATRRAEAPEPEPVELEESSVIATPPSQPDTTATPNDGPLSVASIRTEILERETLVHIEMSAPIGGEQVRLERVPDGEPRWAVSIEGVTRPYRQREIAVGSGELERVRTGFHPSGPALHVVLDLAHADVALRSETNANVTTLTLVLDGEATAVVSP